MVATMSAHPCTQCFVLEDVLDVLNVATASDRTAGLLAECAESMLGWMADIVHPDAEVPLFNDAALGMAPRPKELVAYAKRLGLSVPSSVDVRRRVGARLDSGIVLWDGWPTHIARGCRGSRT